MIGAFLGLLIVGAYANSINFDAPPVYGQSGWPACNIGEAEYNKGQCCEQIGYPTYELCLANLSQPTCCGCFTDRCETSPTNTPMPTPVPPAATPEPKGPPPACQGSPVKYAPTITNVYRLSHNSVSVEWTTTDTESFVVYFGPVGSSLPWNTKVVGNDVVLNDLPSGQPIDVKVCSVGQCGDQLCSAVVDP